MLNKTRVLLYGSIGLILTLMRGSCLYGCFGKTNLTPIFNIPVFAWGLIGYSMLIIWSLNQARLPSRLSKLFFIVSFTYGTSAAIGISIGNFFRPFCFIAWVLNLVIVLDLLISLTPEINLPIKNFLGFQEESLVNSIKKEN